MQENPALYSKLVNSLDGIVWEANGETFQFTFVSPQAERILGYPIERWLEPNFWRDHTHPDDAGWCSAFCLDCFASKVALSFSPGFSPVQEQWRRRKPFSTVFRRFASETVETVSHNRVPFHRAEAR